MDNRTGDNKDGDLNRSRLICLDTESSICLALDRPTGPLRTTDAATQTTPKSSNSNIHSAMADRPHGAPKHPANVSSDSHFVPRVQEINGSSDSQQQQQQQQQQQKQQTGRTQPLHANGLAMLQTEQRELRNDGTSKSEVMPMANTTGGRVSKVSKATTTTRLENPNDTYLHRSLSDTGAALDRELQAAVDMMLHGSSTPIAALPDRSYQFGSISSRNMRLMPAYYADTMSHASGGGQSAQSDRAFVPGSQQYGECRGDEQTETGTRVQRLWQGSKQLKQKLAERLAWRRERSGNDEDTKSLASIEDTESTEHKHGADETDGDNRNDNKEPMQPQQRFKGMRCCHPETVLNSVALTARGGERTTATSIPMIGASLANNRAIGPVVRYVQRRPLTSLGIVLGVLVGLLIIIIVILAVGVFPFLMRSTLQDLSLTVTSVRASAPPQVSRALKMSNSAVSSDQLQQQQTRGLAAFPPPSGVRHNKRAMAFIEMGRDQSPDRRSPAPAASMLQHLSVPMTRAAASTQAHTMQAAPSHPPGMLERHDDHHTPQQQQQRPSLPIARGQVAPSTDDSAKGGSRGPMHSAPPPMAPHAQPASNGGTHHQAHAATRVIIPATATAAAVAAVAPPLILMPGIAAAPSPEQSTSGLKALDTATVTPTTTYMLQIAGNLTSGGPIGVDIEFTEPLRLYWGDTEVGSVASAGPIHVPGRGTSQWSWPAVEVSIPASSAATKSAVISNGAGNDGAAGPPHTLTDKRLLVPHTTPSVAPLKANNALEAGPHTFVQMGAEKAGDAASNGAMAAQIHLINGNAALDRSTAEDAARDHNRGLGKRDNTASGGGSSSGLTAWFAAIRDNRPFTMVWRSHVKISALGLHAKNVAFEKIVNVQCDDKSKNCVITDDDSSAA
ncbi:hypothetical protein IWW48_005825 [Coemansia sp. RSA 1200]|nr:hypothetical protein IWW48_005825 [Coemansia sp. RSA 1200]